MVWDPESSNPIWDTQGNGWGEPGDHWGEPAGPESPKPVIYQTLSETMAATNNLADHPRSHLFLGVSPTTGAPEMFDLKRPRSLVIQDDYRAGSDMLQTMVMALKTRSNQRPWPVTVLTDRPYAWENLKDKHDGISLANISSEGKSIVRVLPIIQSTTKHFLVIENMADLVTWGPQPASVLKILLNSGASGYGVYVLACRQPTGNIKLENELDRWTGGFDSHILHAETTISDTLKLETGKEIFVPEPR